MANPIANDGFLRSRLKMRHVQLLELHLFERTTRGIMPTRHGESLVRHARAILGTLDHARAELHSISDGAMGRITVVARRGHPLCAKPQLRLADLADLADKAWILPPPEAAYRRRLDAAFRQEGVEPPTRLIESLSILTNYALLQESDFIGVMPINVARYYARLGSVELLLVDLPMPSGPVGFVTREATVPSLVFDDLLDALPTVGKAIAGE